MALSSVRVLFNGQWTTLTKNASTGLYEGTVTAPSTPGAQTLTVRAVNSAGYQTEQSTTLNVRLEIIPPVVQFTGPAEDSWSTNPRQPVSFTLRDEAGGSGVAINTLSFSVDGNTMGSGAPGLSYTAVSNGYDCVYTPSSDWSDGEHSISVSVQDGAGNASATVSRSFQIDTSSPTLVLSWPPDGLLTDQEEITVSGTVSDTGPVMVKVNGTSVALTGGAFSAAVHLEGGSNTITVTAEDDAGNISAAVRTVILVTQGPSLTIVSPADGFITNETGILVTGTVSDSVAQVSSVTVNGVAAAISGTTWSATVPLAEGSNTLTAVAANQVGLTTTATRSVTRDSTAPVLTITAPTDNLVTAAQSITVSGTISDDGTVTVTVNGEAAVLSGGTFSASVPLTGGANTITVKATDAAGNVTTSTRTVVRATQGPSVTITSPAEGFITGQTSILVTGTVSDSVAVVSGVTVNGVTASVSGGTFSASVPLAEGDNTITVVGTNHVGLSTTKTVSGIRDTISPSISITAPTAGQMVEEATFTVTGTVSDEHLSGVTVNGTAAAVDGGTFSLEITLTEGPNSITATATDTAGNTATATGSVLLDTLPPALTVTSPEVNLVTNHPSITVSGTASDSGSGVDEVTVNGTAAPITGGSFSKSLTLSEGTNTVTVSATDKMGHVTTITRTVLLDTVPPKFLSVQIAPDLTANPLGQRFVLTAVMAESAVTPKSPELVTGTVNGEPVTFIEGPAYTWTAPIIRAGGDSYEVALHAEDGAGNTADDTVIFPCGMESKWDWTELDFLNYWDLNRVERNTEFLTKWMQERGYGANEPVIRQDWTMPAIPTRSDIDRIRGNVDALREAFLRPEGWREIVYNNTIDAAQMNAMEWDLHLLDLWLDRASKTQTPYSGQIYSGMWP